MADYGSVEAVEKPGKTDLFCKKADPIKRGLRRNQLA
jgi:hypothetical protein